MAAACIAISLPPPLSSALFSPPSPALLFHRALCSESRVASLTNRPQLCQAFRPQRRLSRPFAAVGVGAAGADDSDVASTVAAAPEEISRSTLLWRAAKLPIYSVAVVPLTVGSAAAYFQTGFFCADQYFLLLSASVLVIAWLNLSNDVYDFDTGADKNKRESVVNIIGSRKITQLAANVLLLVGFLGLLWAFTKAGDPRFLMLLICAILCGYVYQCPPFRLSYRGLGEPLCFAAFGPFATTGFYFSSISKSIVRDAPLLPLTQTVLAASVLVGSTTALILFCSHFHQIEGDREVGKMSPLVRIGTEAASRIVSGWVTSIYVLLLAFSLSRALPSACLLVCGLTLPVGKLVVNFVQRNHKEKIKIFMAKYYCVRLHSLFGTALAAGLFFAGHLGRN